jgi:hypothetical protein
MGFHGSISAIQIELRRHTALLTSCQMGIYGSILAIQIELVGGT